MKQFSLDKWLENQSRKVVTRDGNIVEIIYTNGKGAFPVIVIDPYEEETVPWQVTENGKIFGNGDDDKLDLFFADEEKVKSPLIEELEEYFKNTPKEQIEEDWKKIQDLYNQHFANKSNEKEELTEFEKEVEEAYEWAKTTEREDFVNEFAPQLLYLARKELQPEFDKELDKAYKCADKVQYENGKQDALKNLPKWKKATEHLKGEGFIHHDKHDMTPQYADTNVEGGEYYLTLDDLKTLPKEE